MVVADIFYKEKEVVGDISVAIKSIWYILDIKRDVLLISYIFNPLFHCAFSSLSSNCVGLSTAVNFYGVGRKRN